MKLYIKMVIIFFVLIVMNSFIMWAEPVWLKIFPFFEEKTLIHPTIDNIIEILAYIFMAVQLPVLGLFDLLEKLHTFGQLSAILTISLLSTGLFFLYMWFWKFVIIIIKNNMHVHSKKALL